MSNRRECYFHSQDQEAYSRACCMLSCDEGNTDSLSMCKDSVSWTSRMSSETEILEELTTRLSNIIRRLTRAPLRTGYSITCCIFAYPLSKFQYKVWGFQSTHTSTHIPRYITNMLIKPQAQVRGVYSSVTSAYVKRETLFYR